MSAYYNDLDEKACAWTRELIAAKQIPDGIVDCRSITDIEHDLSRFTQVHFFNGISGWARALDLAGWDRNRPVWCASLPCQSFSAAGQQKGFDDERGQLWQPFLALVRKYRPVRIFGEQVQAAIRFGWVDRVRTDLEAEGYTFGFSVLGAHSVGAPHRRQRLYWMANAGQQPARRGDHRPGESAIANREGASGESGRSSLPRGMADTASLHGPEQLGEPREGPRWGAGPHDSTERPGPRGMANSERERLEGHTRHEHDRNEPGRERADEARSTAESGGTGRMGEPDRTGSQPGRQTAEATRQGSAAESAGGDGETVGDPESGGRGEQRHEAQQGRSGHPDGTDGTVADSEHDGGRSDQQGRQSEGRTPDGRSRAGCWDDFDIIPCRDGKARRIERGTFPLVTGKPQQRAQQMVNELPASMVPGGDPCAPEAPSLKEVQATSEARTMRLRGYGNAVVAELAAQFILAAEEALAEQ